MTTRPLYALRLAQHCAPGMSCALAIRLTARWDMKHCGRAYAVDAARKLRLMTWG